MADSNPDTTDPWAVRRAGARFCNPTTDKAPGWKDVARWKLGLAPRERGENPLSCKAYEPRLVAPDWAAMKSPDRAKITATWIGHATFLLQTGGCNFLTDPHFGSYCAPLPLRRYQRRTPPGLTIAQLPHIDAILLTHNHYDHLDVASLRAIVPGKEVFCPLGVGNHLRGMGAARVTELAWGEAALFRNIRLTCTPAQHGSARTPFDRNRTLWCGWMIEQENRRAFFVGDTGYCTLFREIGMQFGPIDLAMIPIGAYRPGWFMHPVHVNPMEALQLHRDLGARQSLAMHWGAFLLADEPLGEPALLLERARASAGLPEQAFRTLGLGETTVV